MAYVVEEDLAIAAVPNAEGFHELGIAAIRSLSDTRELFIVGKRVGFVLTLELIQRAILFYALETR